MYFRVCGCLSEVYTREKQVKRLRVLLADRNRELKRLEREHDQLAMVADELQKDMESQVDEIRQRDRRIVALSVEVSELNVTLRDKEGAIKDLAAEVETANTALREASAQHEGQQAEFEALKARVAGLQSECERLRDELGSAQAKSRGRSDTARTQALGLVLAVERELPALVDEFHARTLATLQELRGVKEAVAHDNEELRRARQALVEQAQDTQRQLDKLSEHTARKLQQNALLQRQADERAERALELVQQVAAAKGEPAPTEVDVGQGQAEPLRDSHATDRLRKELHDTQELLVAARQAQHLADVERGRLVVRVHDLNVQCAAHACTSLRRAYLAMADSAREGGLELAGFDAEKVAAAEVAQDELRALATAVAQALDAKGALARDVSAKQREAFRQAVELDNVQGRFRDAAQTHKRLQGTLGKLQGVVEMNETTLGFLRQ